MSKLTRALTAATLAAILAALLVPAVASAAFPLRDRYAWISQWYWSGHRAIDIAAPIGTDIMAMRSGRVVQVGWRSDCGGYRVVVYHGDGMYSGYYHMSHVHAYKGEWVTGGSTIIGYVGESGCATGPHTHVSLWHGFPWGSGSYAVNPWKYVWADSGYFLPLRYRAL